MSLLQISLLVTLLVNLAMGSFVLMNNPRRGPNQQFFVLSLILAVWLASVLRGTMSTTQEQAEFWIRVSTAVAFVIPLGVNGVRLSLVLQPYSGRRLLRRLILWYASCLVIMPLLRTNYFLRGAIMPDGVHGVARALYGPGITVYLACSMSLWIIVLILMLRDLRNSKGMTSIELQFILLASAFAVSYGAIIAYVMPVLTGVEFAPISPFGVVILDIGIAYGIATRRIMEATEFLRRATAYALLTFYLVVLYLVVWFPLARIPVRTQELTLIPHILAALVVAFTATPAYGRVQRFANRLFINSRPLDVGSVMQRANRIMDSISTLGELLRRFAGSIGEALGTDRVLILLLDRNSFEQKYPEPGAAPPLRIELHEPMVQALKELSGPLNMETMARQRSNQLLTRAAERMLSLKTPMAVRIHSKSGQEGMLLLGPRLSGRIYGAVEQDTLQMLCNQLAVALENARLYTEVQDGRIYNDILLDNLVSGVIAANGERIITVFNREAQRITRRQASEVLGRPISVLPEPLMSALNQAYERGSSQRDRDLVVVHGPNDETPVRLGSTVFRGHAGNVLGALLVFNDLTALRRLELQVRRTDRLASLGTLVAGMAHEIKNPLVSIKTFTDLLPDRYADPDFRDTFSSLVGQEVRRIDTIVNKLLNFSKPTRPHLVPVHLHQVMDSSLQLIAQRASQKNIQLIRRFEASRDRVLADSEQLNQAFINILLNGLDAINNGSGVLTVSTELLASAPFDPRTQEVEKAEGPYVRVAVSDTGEGIPPENLPRVFDPFFTTKSHGTGLGLAVAHGIIQEHKGIADVTSEVGQGSTFHIFFPLMPEEEVVT